MKTIFKTTFVAVALLIGTTVSAQEAGALKFGVQVGANLSNVSGDVDNTDAKIGFQGGITADYFLTESVFLQSGLAYTNKGYKAEAEAIKTKITANLNYLQLPIHIGYNIPVSEGLSVNLHAGPYLAYGIGGQTKTKVDGTEISDIDAFGDKGTNENFEFGLSGGVGLGLGAININLGYEYGLSNSSKVDGISIHNNNAYLSLGYKF